MQYFRDMRIGARLAIGFALVIFSGLLVAGYSSFQLSQASSGVHYVADDLSAKIDTLADVKDNANLIARVVRNMALMEDADQRVAEKARIEQARAENSEMMKRLEQTIKSEQGKAKLKAVMEARPLYNTASDKAIALALADQRAEAAKLLLNEVRDAQRVYFKALDELNDSQLKLMHDTASHIGDDASLASKLMIGVALFSALAGAGIAWAVTRSITRPMDLAIGAANRIQAGDLTGAIDSTSRDETGRLLSAMQAMQASLVQVVASVRTNADSVATASAQIAHGNQDLSQRTEEQASSLQQAAATMDELGSTARNNTDSAHQANQLAQGASDVAVKGGEVVNQVVQTMRGISDSSKRISEIIGVIDGIAFQTNILALNAAVEAARAGEQGRGFAVVAGEVRSLAQRSAEAAKEIKALISASAERVDQGTSLADQAGQTMNEVVASIRRVTDIVGEISSASSEQTSGVQQVATAVNQMDQVTQQNAALVEQSSAAAESLREQAGALVQAVSVFRLQQNA